MDRLRKIILNNEHCDFPISLQWKLLLECIPSLDQGTWPIIFAKERQGYADLKKTLVINPSKHETGNNLTIFNPLSLEDESPWTHYFKDAELIKLIRQDVERTFPDVGFFKDQEIQTMMTDILFIWSKLNPDVSYRQGMHEIVAPVIYIVYQDAVQFGSTSVNHPKEFVEHDSWMLFHRIMQSAKSWFQLENEAVFTKDSPGKKMSDIPIVIICQRIQNDWLRAIDFDLYNHLHMLGIEPQLYGIRWIRLIFGREFCFKDVIQLWTFLFAEDANLGLVEWFCVAILCNLRDDRVLQHLMHFSAAKPNQKDLIRELMQKAIDSRLKYKEKLLKISTTPGRPFVSRSKSQPWTLLSVNDAPKNNRLADESAFLLKKFENQDLELSNRLFYIQQSLSNSQSTEEIQKEIQEIAMTLVTRWTVKEDLRSNLK